MDNASACSIEDCSWTAFSVKDSDERWLIKCAFNFSCYEIAISNMEVVCKEKLEGREIQDRCLSLNPRLDAPLVAIIDHLKCSIVDRQKLSTEFSIEEKGSKMTLSFCNKFCNRFPFKWSFDFDLSAVARQDTTRNFLSFPLILAVNKLLVENSRLKEIILKKDSEIKDYKDHGGKVSRAFLETKPFKAGAFEKDFDQILKYTEAMKDSCLKIMTDKTVFKELDHARKSFKCSNDSEASSLAGNTRQLVNSPSKGNIKRINFAKPTKRTHILNDDDDEQGDDISAKQKIVTMSNEDESEEKKPKMKPTDSTLHKKVKKRKKNLLL